MSTSYTDQGRKPKTFVAKRNITNADGTRTEITTTTITTYTALKEETTQKVDTKHFPSHPKVRRDGVTLDDGTTGWKKKQAPSFIQAGREKSQLNGPMAKRKLKLKNLPRMHQKRQTTTMN
mmetsp:Transcript_7082/g.11074  ORF Transcript_7082/g.11074 Transcript_7082/m.11074 type:complete len:121 (-) Transcript_7082:57-419(-)